MAKLDTLTVKKQKATKRKNPNPEHEDEVANKSVILEEISKETNTNTDGGQVYTVTTKKSKKRKNKDKSVIKEKRSKSSDEEGDNADTSDHEVVQHAGDVDDDADVFQPTLEQLKECENPENKSAIVTGRQKKKQKHQKLLEAQKGQSLEKEKQRNDEYLRKWKNSREDWKFEKLRQISIQQTMFDDNILSGEMWNIALEYLAGSKGSAKEKVIKMANDVIDEIDKLCEENDNEEEKQVLVNSNKYQRARDLLQIFD